MKNILKYVFVFFISVLARIRRLFRGQRFVDLRGARCLVVSLSGIGNAIMCTPLIRELKETAKVARVDVLTSGPAHNVVFSGIEFCDDIMLYPKRWKQRWHLLVSLRRKRYDIFILTFPIPEIHYALLPLIINPGMAITHRYDLFHPYFKYVRDIADRVVDIDTTCHDIEQNIHLIQDHLSYSARINDYPHFRLSSNAQKAAEDYFVTHKIQTNVKLCFIHPGGKRGAFYKRWPLENFISLANRLERDHHMKIVVIIGPDEYEHHDLFVKHGFYTVTSEDFATTLAILRHADLLISNDSGLMHAAALLGLPTVTIWGGTDVNRNGARGNMALNITNEHITCRPCVRFVPNIHCPDGPYECIRSISVEQVYHAMLARQLLGRNDRIQGGTP